MTGHKKGLPQMIASNASLNLKVSISIVTRKDPSLVRIQPFYCSENE